MTRRKALPTDQTGDEPQISPVGGHTLDSSHRSVEPHGQPAAVDLLPTDQTSHDAQLSRVGGHPSTISHSVIATQARHADGQPLTGHRLSETHDRTAGQTLATDQRRHDTQSAIVGGDLLDDSHSASAAQQAPAVVEPSDLARVVTSPKTDPRGHFLSDDQTTLGSQATDVVADLPATDQRHRDSHCASVGGSSSNQPPTRCGSKPRIDPSGGWLELRIWAETFQDAMDHRIAGLNRVGLSIGTKAKHDLALDGHYFIRQATTPSVDPALYLPYLSVLLRSEHEAHLGLVRSYRRIVPAAIIAWQKNQKGIGDHLLARLLGHLGHPVIATPHHWEGTGAKRVLKQGEPYERTIAQLWSYCGHGDPTRKRTKGMTAEDAFAMGNPHLKMIVHLIATKCMMQQPGNTYRDVYEKRRQNTEGRVHATDCVRCGPSGKPAKAGTPWSKAHSHADALRIVGKELLRDLWLVAR